MEIGLLYLFSKIQQGDNTIALKR